MMSGNLHYGKVLHPTKCETILEDKVNTLPIKSFRIGEVFYFGSVGEAFISHFFQLCLKGSQKSTELFNNILFLIGGACCLGTANQLNEVFTHLKDLLETLKFGSITLVVQDGKVVQIEKNEKVRLK